MSEENKAKRNLLPRVIGAAVLIAVLLVGPAACKRKSDFSPRVPRGFKIAPLGDDTNPSWASAIIHKKTGIEMVLIPEGTFLMGSPESEKDRHSDEGPQHKVRITKPFYMGKYEVTQAEWRKLMGNNPSYFKGDDRLPVEQVSWDDCQAFLKKAGDGLALPTEAQWEYACRAGTQTPFHFGETIGTDQATYFRGGVDGTGAKGQFGIKTTAVGSFPSNAWGLYDMHGNVWEWCQDWYLPMYYKESAVDDPTGPADGGFGTRVLRGGSAGYDPWSCRSACRHSGIPDARIWSDAVGFRVVLVPAP